MDIYNFLNGDKCENANIGRLKDYAKNNKKKQEVYRRYFVKGKLNV